MIYQALILERIILATTGRYQTKVKLDMNDDIAFLYQILFPRFVEVIEEANEIGHSIQHKTYLFLTRSLLKLK